MKLFYDVISCIGAASYVPAVRTITGHKNLRIVPRKHVRHASMLHMSLWLHILETNDACARSVGTSVLPIVPTNGGSGEI
jgi:hypothetical protein